MAAPLDPKLADLLIRLLHLDGGDYDTFHPYFSGGSEGEAELIGHDDERVPEGAIKELDRLGYIDMRPEPGKRLGPFSITTEGRSLGGQLASAGDGAVDLSWPAVELVLRRIHNAWKREGAPQLGIPGAKIMGEIEPPMETAQFAAIPPRAGAGRLGRVPTGTRSTAAAGVSGPRRARSLASRAGRPMMPGSPGGSSWLCWRSGSTRSPTPRSSRSYGLHSRPEGPP